jgi:hypothetical protein
MLVTKSNSFGSNGRYEQRRGLNTIVGEIDDSAEEPKLKPTIIAREALDVVSAIPIFVAAPLLRPWHTRWGATKAETRAAMPGDECFPRAGFQATRAITIDAPPSDVWPWLLQVGYGRAGFYSYDLLDGLGRPSEERVVPELQAVRLGDWVPMSPTVNDKTAFKVDSLEPCSWMLWRKPDSTWAWQLKASTGGTRLITRVRVVYPWRKPLAAVLSVFLMEFGDFAMMRRMLKGIKRRAETRMLEPTASVAELGR